jgi:hypothetical protein
MIMADPLHVIFLGLGRDFVTSIIKFLVRCGHFGNSVFDTRLHVAFCAFLDWAGRRSVSIQGFSLKSKVSYETINGKAMDIKLMIGWLAAELWGYHGAHADLVHSTSYALAQCVMQMFTCFMLLVILM